MTRMCKAVHTSIHEYVAEEVEGNKFFFMFK